MKRSGLAIIISLLWSIDLFSQDNLVGHYEVTRRTFFQKTTGPLSKYDSRIVGSELALNSDSTFQYTSCGNFMKGIWTSDADSVFLSVHHNEYRSDSLKKTGKQPEYPKQPISLKIETKGKDRIILYRVFDNTIELLGKRRIGKKAG